MPSIVSCASSNPPRPPWMLSPRRSTRCCNSRNSEGSAPPALRKDLCLMQRWAGAARPTLHQTQSSCIVIGFSLKEALPCYGSNTVSTRECTRQEWKQQSTAEHQAFAANLLDGAAGDGTILDLDSLPVVLCVC